MEAETKGQREFPEVDSYSTAVLLLSGGTTGVPKLIPRTHTDYMYNARMSAKRCQLDENSVYLAALPVAHNFPLCCPGLLGTLDAGGKVVLAPTTSPDDILTAITEEKVTITALVPAMVTVCMEMLEYDEDYDISSLKILQVGGAMLEDSLADKIIEEWPCTLMQVFGTAEGLLSFTSLDDDPAIIARCQGTPVSPADEVKIVDEKDEEVPIGVFGELLSRGPYTIDGYYMAEEANKTSFTDDVLPLIKERKNVIYYFSDISYVFLREAQHKYSEFRNIKYMTLNVNNLDLGKKVDIIIANGVLNNAKNIKYTLDKMLEITSEKGKIFIIEQVEESLEMLVSQVFMMKDSSALEEKGGKTFRNTEEWLRLLRDDRIEKIEVFPEKYNIDQRLFILYHK